MLEEYRSPNIPSNVQAAGKYAKKEGCCQWVKPTDGRVKKIDESEKLHFPGTIYL